MSSEEKTKTGGLRDKKVKEYKTFFYFPFRVSEKELKKFKKDINKKKGRWRSQTYQLWDGTDKKWKTHARNNQVLLYFHEYLRDVLFDSKQKENEFLTYYSCFDSNDNQSKNDKDFAITINDKETDFYISDIAMYLFKSLGIGILTVGVCAKGCSIQEALEFNHKFRLLYISDIRQLKEGRIFKKITVSGLGISAEFSNDKHLFVRGSAPAELNGFIDALLPFSYKDGYRPILDDRMVLHSMLILGGSEYEELKKNKEMLDILLSRFLYVDKYGDDYEYNKEFIKQLMTENVYKRFFDNGSIYGFCRYADVMIGFNPPKFVIENFSDVYYMTSILALFYRCALIEYAKRACEVSKKIIENEQWTDNSDARKLRKSFLEFTNVWYFRELTNQDMGIEMFEMHRKAYQLDELYRGVKEDIENLDDFIEMEYAREETQAITDLTKLGVPLAILAVITGLLGMDMKSGIIDIIKGKVSFLELNKYMGNFLHDPDVVPNILFSILAFFTLWFSSVAVWKLLIKRPILRICTRFKKVFD